MRPLADRVIVAAWFHPHAPVGRAVATWKHTGRHFPRSAGLALKGVCTTATMSAATAPPTPSSPPPGSSPTSCGDRDPRRPLPAPPCPGGSGACGGGSGQRGTARPASVPTPRLQRRPGPPTQERPRWPLRRSAWSPRGGRSIALDLVGGNAEHLAEALAGLPHSVAVRRLGPRPPADVHALMRAADALLLPSLFEEWGYVGVEAALQGTPVVTLPVYPFEEMLAGALGRCAPGMDAPAFAGAIEELLADPAGPARRRRHRREAVWAAGRRWASHGNLGGLPGATRGGLGGGAQRLRPVASSAARPAAAIADPGPLTATRHRGVEAFLSLEPAWRRLLQRTGTTNPFLSWEWVSEWARSFWDERLVTMVVEHLLGLWRSPPSTSMRGCPRQVCEPRHWS